MTDHLPRSAVEEGDVIRLADGVVMNVDLIEVSGDGPLTVIRFEESGEHGGTTSGGPATDPVELIARPGM